MKFHYFLILILSHISALFASQQAGSYLLGKIVFPTSANLQASEQFIKGVLLLHSFEYDRARAAFQKAEEMDKDFALAYWGEAMTYNHPLWDEQDLGQAKKALNKLADSDSERISKAKTGKEKGFILAVNLLFGEGSKEMRNASYSEAMRKLYQQYPEDDEIALFYALSLLGLVEGKRDPQVYMQAAAISEDASQRNPKHPGALHYAIHAYDDPIHAPLGLRAARNYAKIASNSSHALHMPSHIYLALGLWNDVIASNQSAWEAGLSRNPDRDPGKIHRP